MDWLNGINEAGVIFRHSHQKFSLIRINVECKAIAVGTSSSGRGGQDMPTGYSSAISIDWRLAVALRGHNCMIDWAQSPVLSGV